MPRKDSTHQIAKIRAIFMSFTIGGLINAVHQVQTYEPRFQSSRCLRDTETKNNMYLTKPNKNEGLSTPYTKKRP